MDSADIAKAILDAYAERRTIPAPALDMPGAYAVESEIVRLRAASGHKPVGVKVGFANKAMWRVLKLDTLVYGHMYDDTVQFASGNQATLVTGPMFAPKIEPEIVFKMRRPLGAADVEPAQILDAVEWLALGFEIIDCVFPDWKFQATDFVASRGLHAGLVVGDPLPVSPDNIAMLAESLPSFTVSLRKNGEQVSEGSGKNSLKSPALCLAELTSAMAKQNAALAAGDLISSGTLTDSQFIAPGETWSAFVTGLPLPALTVAVS